MTARLTSVKIIWGTIFGIVGIGLINKVRHRNKADEWEQYKKEHGIDMVAIRNTLKQLAEQEDRRLAAQKEGRVV